MITVRVRRLRDDPERRARVKAKWRAFIRARLREKLIAIIIEPNPAWKELP